MSDDTASPYRAFKERICAAAQGRHGIRNPVVIAAVAPEVERRVADRLASWATAKRDEADLKVQTHVVLLLDLGSLYPFTRASELLDELDRLNVESTIAVPVPVPDSDSGPFSGDDSRRYCPAHRIDGQIREEHLQR